MPLDPQVRSLYILFNSVVSDDKYTRGAYVLTELLYSRTQSESHARAVADAHCTRARRFTRGVLL